VYGGLYFIRLQSLCGDSSGCIESAKADLERLGRALLNPYSTFPRAQGISYMGGSELGSEVQHSVIWILQILPWRPHPIAPV